MLRNIMLIPIGSHVKLTDNSIGLIKAIQNQNLRVCFFKPVVQQYNSIIKNNTTYSILKKSFVFCIEPIVLMYTESFFYIDYISILINKIVSQFYKYESEYDIVVIEGFKTNEIGAISNILNYRIAITLNTEIVFVIQEDNNIEYSFIECTYFLKKVFKDNRYLKFSNLIINKTKVKLTDYGMNHLNVSNKDIELEKKNQYNDFYKDKELFFKENKLQILAVIPFNIDCIKIQAMYFFQHIEAYVINISKMHNFFIENVILFNQYFFDALKNKRLKSILIISFDQCKYINEKHLNQIKNSKIIAILLTEIKKNEYKDTILFNFHKYINIPIFLVSMNTVQVLSKLNIFNMQVDEQDYIRIKKIKYYISRYICHNWLLSLHNSIKLQENIPPAVFIYRLIKLSRIVKKRILLPEGYDKRIIKAAFVCQKKGIANCILLGSPQKIKAIALREGIILDKNNDIIDPKKIRNNYVQRLVNLRSYKGMTVSCAEEMVRNNIILGTLILENNDVDGMVSGIVNTTANIIRPALQLIKIKKDVSLVSSLFFMLVSNKVIIYADCAINIEPNANELADIAIQSADSAQSFGIYPRIAMISYSTHASGSGRTVDKVREATFIVKKKRPDLIVDGPLQYDAATIPEVAMIKSPESIVAGSANVLIFPDLNTGNTVYKAVQRLAKVIAIGPILQGLRKPVNDLSRGATIEDIIYTIAITAIQST